MNRRRVKIYLQHPGEHRVLRGTVAEPGDSCQVRDHRGVLVATVAIALDTDPIHLALTILHPDPLPVNGNVNKVNNGADRLTERDPERTVLAPVPPT